MAAKYNTHKTTEELERLIDISRICTYQIMVVPLQNKLKIS